MIYDAHCHLDLMDNMLEFIYEFICGWNYTEGI